MGIEKREKEVVYVTNENGQNKQWGGKGNPKQGEAILNSP